MVDARNKYSDPSQPNNGLLVWVDVMSVAFSGQTDVDQAGAGLVAEFRW